MKPWIFVIAFAVLGSGMYLLVATREVEPSSTVRTEFGVPAKPRVAPAPVAWTRPARPSPANPVEDEPVGAAGVAVAEAPSQNGSAVTSEEMRDQMQASFVAAPLTASRDRAQSLENGVRAALPKGSSVLSVECRDSLCRIETVHASGDEFRDFVRHAFQDATRISSGPAFVSLLDESQPGQPMTAIAYVGPEGSTLPMPGSAASTGQR